MCALQDERLSPLGGVTAGEFVDLVLEEETIRCRVRRVAADELTLVPASAADVGYIPRLGRSAVLATDRVRLDGNATPGAGADELRFRPGEVNPLARRRAGRIELEVELLLNEGGGRRRLRTLDLSLGGLGVLTGAQRLTEGANVRFRLELPGGSPVVGVARVVRAGGDAAGLEFTDVAPADLARLATYLIEANAPG